MMIKDLFKGKTPKSQLRLDNLSKKLGQNPNIAWYPSAGLDFRDLIEVNRTSIQPDLHIHTDYHLGWTKLEIGEIFNDERTKVSIINIDEIQFKKSIDFFVNPNYVDFPEDAPKEPLVLLLDVLIESNNVTIEKPVLYIYMENINFLDEILLKEQLPISHLIKIREGCGMGGNRKSISIVYAFLCDLRIKYLLVDNEEHTDFELIHQLASKHNINLKNYHLRNISQRRNIADWSGFNAKVMKVVFNEDESLNDDRINELLKIIKKH